MWEGRAGQPAVNLVFFVDKKFTVRFRLASKRAVHISILLLLIINS